MDVLWCRIRIQLSFPYHLSHFWTCHYHIVNTKRRLTDTCEPPSISIQRCFRSKSSLADQDPTTSKQSATVWHDLSMVNVTKQCQSMKTSWQGHSFQALVKPIAKCQALKTAWQGHSLQALPKPIAKCQILKTSWQGHSFQALVKPIAKCQALKAAWQSH